MKNIQIKMAQALLIQIDFLKYLQAEGYHSLLLKFGEQIYIPMKSDADDLMAKISIVPFREDEVLSVSDAIDFFYELGLEDQYILNIFETE